MPPAASSRRAPGVRESSLRPPVPADSRLLSWSSPFAQSQISKDERKLPSELISRSRLITFTGLAPNTKSSYAAGLLRFTQFCDRWDIPESDRMPASASLLIAFISQYAGYYGGSTFNLWLSGIRSWHILNQAPWFGDDDRVKLARSAAARLGTSFKKPLRSPVSLDHLRLLKSKLSLSTPFDAALWATALVSFFGCCRLGEMTVSSPSKFSSILNVTRATAVQFKSLPSGSSASFRIPWTKTTKTDGALVVVTSRTDDLCPVEALKNHFTVNIGAPPSVSLFGYRLNDGSWSHMLKGTFMSSIGVLWSSPSLPLVSGHSFRIGGAVALLLAGVSPDVVAATGGWTSLAFLLYWRRLEDIVPLSTSHAYLRSHFTEISSVMEDFRVRSGIPVIPSLSL